jgi:hypothetical protein
MIIKSQYAIQHEILEKLGCYIPDIHMHLPVGQKLYGSCQQESWAYQPEQASRRYTKIQPLHQLLHASSSSGSWLLTLYYFYSDR